MNSVLSISGSALDPKLSVKTQTRSLHRKAPKSKSWPREPIQATFRAWDKDGNGKLSKREFFGVGVLGPRGTTQGSRRFCVLAPAFQHFSLKE